MAALLLLSSLARPQSPRGAQAEIVFLLAEVANSSCQFYRNGTWYDATRAAAHLQEKYGAAASAARAASAEDFIERVGTRSSLSGVDYAISCPGAMTVPSAQWLRAKLAGYRLAHR